MVIYSKDDPIPITLESTKFFQPSKKDKFTVLSTMQRTDNNFIQGLYFDQQKKVFLVSSGLYGQSTIQYLEGSKILTPRVTTALQKKYFGEGVAPVSEKTVLMLTWRERKIFEFDRDTLRLEKTSKLLRGIREGWGITSVEVEGKKFYKLYISDGTDVIKVVDWEKKKIIGKLRVRDRKGKSIDRINELEYRAGYIYANVWGEDRVLKIDATTGKVTG
jgi:glutamine cyclotransferase